MSKNHTVSVIVPAYNEEKYIRSVLEELKKAKNIFEIICINDGSQDNTLSQVQMVKGITILDLKENKGKSNAVVKGIDITKGDIIAFVDADLTGNIADAVDALVAPLLHDECDATVGYPKANSLDSFCKPLSGERAYYKKDLLPHLNKLQKKGYGMELFLNYTFRDKHIKCFPLKGVTHIMKHKKQSYKTVVHLTIVEVLDLLSEVFSQKNPSSFFLRSYIYSFYLKKPVKKDIKIEEVIESVRDFIKKQLA